MPFISEPGEHIGIRLAQNVLAEVTQDSLSSFHSAGLGSEIRDQSLLDIIDGVGIGSMDIIPVKKKYLQRIKKDILFREFKYYVISITNSLIATFDQDNFWYKIGRDLDILPGPAPYDDLIIIRFYLDYKKLKEDGRTLKFIATNVFWQFDYVYFSPDFMGIIDVHISNLIYVSHIVGLVNAPIGLSEIKECVLKDDKVETRGSNLMELSQHRCVDMKLTTSTDIRDVEKCLGLEAAREVIYREVLSRCGNSQSAHFIADFMTCKGHFYSFRKDNPMLKDKGFLVSAAFERPKQDIKQAVKDGIHVDTNASVYSQIMTGSLPNTGTGSHLFEILESHKDDIDY